MMQRLLRTLSRPTLIAAVALASVGMAHAQTTALVIDDFEDGDLSEYNQFAGGEASVLSTTDNADGAFALEFATDADDYGDFAGFFRLLPGAPYDLGALEDAYLVFDLDVTAPLTLEINFQDGDGQSGGEIRNALVFGEATGGYERFALPLLSFFDTRDTDLDDAAVNNIVFTIVNATGDGDSGTAETVVRLDNVRLGEGATLTDGTLLDSFDDGDFSEYFVFAGAEGPALSATTDTPDGSTNALKVMVDADDYGNDTTGRFAGFGKTVDGAPIDVADADALNFAMRANGAGTLEVNIQSGAANNDAGTQLEGRETIRLVDTGGEWVPISIPLNAFIQTRATPADPSDIYNVVLTFVGLETADGDSDTQDFTFEMDNLSFGSLTVATASEALPEVFETAPLAFPNPTVGAATVAFDLAAPTAVRVEVFDLLGRRVATLADGPEAAGPVRLGVSTETFAPGTYLVRIATEEGVATTRLTVVR